MSTVTAAVERVYIGGLNPPYLSPEDIVKRLQSLEGIVIESANVKDNKPYVHLKVRSKDLERSALDIISKQYHNVKWKSCKLIVQASRPHFLERLAQEREERQNQKFVQNENTTCNTNHTTDTSPPQDNQTNKKEGEEVVIKEEEEKEFVTIPRRLRIRKRYGDEAHHVDTKPCLVNDWKGFSKALQISNKRRIKLIEAQNNKNISGGNEIPRSSIPPSRAVHIRFSDSITTSVKSKQGLERNNVDKNNNGKSDTTGDDDYNLSPANKTSNYQWSDEGDNEDEDEDDDDDDEEEEKDSSESDDNEMSEAKDVASSDKSSIVSESSSVTTSSERNNDNENYDSNVNKKEIVTIQKTKNSKDTYEWSSDDSSDSDVVSKTRSFSGPFQPQTSTISDEFAAGFDSDTDSQKSDNDDNNSYKNQNLDKDNLVDSNLDLEADKQSNLNVLSSLFPDIKVKSADAEALESDSSLDDKQNQKRKKNAATTTTSSASGWGANGVMLRYDPTQDTSYNDAITTDRSDLESESAESESSDEEMQDENKGSDCQSNEKDSDNDNSSDSDSEDDDDDDKSDTNDDDDKNNNNNNKEEENDKAVHNVQSKIISSTESNVYEQDKLEDVFRTAREDWERNVPKIYDADPNETTADNKNNNNDKSFSFGFQLDTPQNEKEPLTNSNSTGFSFGFNLGQDSNINNSNSKTNNNVTTVTTPINIIGTKKDDDNSLNNRSTTVTTTDTESSTTPKLFIRRRGIEYPDSVLDSYMSLFFSLNDGQKIIEDVEAYQNDEKVQEEWNKERLALTQDWKRKRKLAQNRNQKRTKFR